MSLPPRGIKLLFPLALHLLQLTESTSHMMDFTTQKRKRRFRKVSQISEDKTGGRRAHSNPILCSLNY